MKAIFILTLFLFSFLNSQSEDITNDVIQYGFNYIGDLKDGKRHGNGKYIYPNGDTYEGEWNYGIREGEGTFTYKDDSHTYVGNFLANVFHGWGTLHIIGGEK